ncbi:MAG: NINE protein [Burkholderiaceae bacterium]|jgi:TM2 domain-containing membrane protein YozV
MASSREGATLSARPTRTGFKNKTLATVLAALLGTFGAHRFYLNGSKGWLPWVYPAYFFLVFALALHYLAQLHSDLGSDFISFLHPALLAAFLPTAVACGEALYFALTPDAKWDACWNADAGRASHSGAFVIVVAILTLALGATGILSILAITVQAYFEGTI